MFLPRYDVYCVSLTKQKTVKCYVFVLCKKVENFAKQSFVVRRLKDFCALFNVIIIDAERRTSLAAENSEMTLISSSIKWRQPGVCLLIHHGSRPMKSQNEL